MMRKWVLAALIGLVGLVAALGVNHHHYARQHSTVTRADMYVGAGWDRLPSDMYGAPSDMY
jgi:hypothetical protein